jgi:hypothetical protein
LALSITFFQAFDSHFFEIHCLVSSISCNNLSIIDDNPGTVCMSVILSMDMLLSIDVLFCVNGSVFEYVVFGLTVVIVGFWVSGVGVVVGFVNFV